MPYHTILYYTILYCTVLYCTVLYCTVLRRERDPGRNNSSIAFDFHALWFYFSPGTFFNTVGFPDFPQFLKYCLRLSRTFQILSNILGKSPTTRSSSARIEATYYTPEIAEANLRWGKMHTLPQRVWNTFVRLLACGFLACVYIYIYIWVFMYIYIYIYMYYCIIVHAILYYMIIFLLYIDWLWCPYLFLALIYTYIYIYRERDAYT